MVAGGESVAWAGDRRDVRTRDVFGVVNQGDNALIITFGGHRTTARVPRSLPDAVRAVFGPALARADSPSVVRWLSADAGIVPWHPREDVAALAAWATDGRAPVLRLVTGAGGQGKTVLGMQVAERLEANGHVAGFVRLPTAVRKQDDVVAQAREQERWLAQWSEILAGGLAAARLSRGSVLLIVDYAENQLEAVEDLLSALVGAAEGHGRIKALLLARSSHGWWADVGVLHPDQRWVETAPLALDPLTDELDDAARRRVWADAVGAFTEVAEKAGYVPVDGEMIGVAPTTVPTTLDLYASALLRVLDARSPTRRRPDGDPLAGVLEHERRVLGLSWQGAGIRATADQLAEALLAAFLVPASSTADGADVLVAMPSLRNWADLPPTREGHPHQAHQAAHHLGRLYPDSSGGLWCAPTPDRLPDTHLLQVLQEAPSDSDAVNLLRAAGGRVSARDAAVPHLLLALARSLTTPAADRNYPGGRRRLVSGAGALFRAYPRAFLAPVVDLELRTLDQALLDALSDLPGDVVRLIHHGLVSRGFSVSRAGLSVDVSRRIVSAGRGGLADSADQRRAVADDLVFLSNRLSDAGRREEALAPAQEAVDLYRELARVNPDAYTPALAASVNNLAISLGEVGRREEALAPAQKAVDLYRELARVNPDAYTPALAMSVNNLAVSLAAVGWREEALAPAQEAADLYRGLARVNPDAYTPALAASVNNLAISLGEVGRREEALAPAQEAADLRRELARVNPDAYTPALAMSVNNLAISLAAVGRREEALAPAQEAADLYRGLARVNPDAYTPDLAMSVNNLANRLAAVGRREEALAPAQEAADLRRELARVNPDAYTPDLAASVNNLAVSLAAVGRGQEAGAVWERAVVGLSPEAAGVFGVLRAGWKWTRTGDDEAERQYLQAHAGQLLAEGSEQILLGVLRYQSLEEAQRYLSLIRLARTHGIDYAYAQMLQ